jgi:hypothetical protein
VFKTKIIYSLQKLDQYVKTCINILGKFGDEITLKWQFSVASE